MVNGRAGRKGKGEQKEELMPWPLARTFTPQSVWGSGTS